VETKTKKQKTMVFLENATKYASYLIHALRAYTIIDSTSHHQQPPNFEGTAIFPKDCGNNEGTTATIISKILVGVKEKADKEKIVIEGYPEKPTSSDLRSGTGLFIANHESKSLLLICLIIELCIYFLSMNYLY
jgi:hypothetical protein